MDLDFITADMFASFLGCLTIVAIMTQALKSLLNVKPLWITFANAVLVGVIRIVIMNVYTPTAIILGILNIFVIYLGAIGGYETVKHIVQSIKKEG